MAETVARRAPERPETAVIIDGDEFFADTPTIRAFVAGVRRILARHPQPPAAIAALRPHFDALLADPAWLPGRYAEPSPAGDMGGEIGQWLLFRAAGGAFTLFSLVVPPGARTPVHDHLTWGLVGLYRGEQEETVYRRVDDGADAAQATLEVAAVRTLGPGEVYELLPPLEDIHAVKTISAAPSVSIHLLGRDVGSLVRHAFEPQTRRVRLFQSGYSNVR